MMSIRNLEHGQPFDHPKVSPEPLAFHYPTVFLKMIGIDLASILESKYDLLISVVESLVVNQKSPGSLT